MEDITKQHGFLFMEYVEAHESRKPQSLKNELHTNVER